MLRDVNITITDGQLSAGGNKGEGVHLKIGASPADTKEVVAIRGTYDAKRIKSLLGISPLADACMDSVENGANLIYCIPVNPSTAGTIGAVTKTGTGTGNLTITGAPNNAFDVIVKITEAGGLNAGAFNYSINGGLTTSDEITIPLLGKYLIPDTGLTLVFTEGATSVASFATNDKFSAKATAPALTNSDITTAIAKIKNLQQEVEFTHIVGETASAAWAAVSTVQQTLVNNDKIPMMFVLEAYGMGESEVLTSYVDSLIASRKSVNNYDLQIVTARCNYLRMDGTTRNINMAGIVCGLYAKAKVQQSIGETKSFALSPDKVLKLMPDGIEDHIQYLDEAGFLTFREYVGLSGYYVTNARVACPEGSDYQYAEHTRVKNKIMRQVRSQSLAQMHTEIDMQDVEGSLAALGKILESPLDQMVQDKEISSARIIIPAGQDVLKNEKVNLKVRFIPKGYTREFEIDLGMERA